MPEPLAVPQVRQAHANPAGEISPGENASLQAAVREARYSSWPVEGELAAQPQNKGVALFAANPAQNLTARFLENGGVRFESGQPGKSWQGELRRSGSGPSPAWKASATRTESSGEGINEWVENGPAGFEQGFTLATRPAGSDENGPATLGVTLTGLRADADPAPSRKGDLIFIDPVSDETVIGYRDLKVWDAAGRQLAAAMHPTAAGFLIAISDQGAKYPLTIDPLVVSLEQQINSGELDPGRAGSVNGTVAMRSNDTAVVGVSADKAVYVFFRQDAIWTLNAKLTAGGTGNTGFGSSVAIGSGGLIVGAPNDDNGYGSAYVFVQSGQTWSMQKKLFAADGISGDQFGTRVATYGSFFVSATIPSHGFGDTGKVYVYGGPATSWAQQAMLTRPDIPPVTPASTLFGSSLAAYGNFLAVGMPAASGGKVAVYVQSEGRWSVLKILSADSVEMDGLGSSVSISGNTFIVGAPNTYKPPGSLLLDRGAALIFTYDGTNWTKQARLEPDDDLDQLYFGTSVSIFEETLFNPATAVVSTSPTTASGKPKKTYIYTRSGTSWSKQATIEGDYGGSLVVNINTLLVGPDARVFSRSGSAWTQQQQLTLNRPAGDDFGLSVDIDGDEAVVGALQDDTPAGADAGSAYVFSRSGTTWTHQAHLVDASTAAGDRFGVSVGISGNTVIVGSDFDDEGGINDRGSARIFVRNIFGNWGIQGAKLLLENGAGANFGRAVAVDGSLAVIGAPYALGTGRAWILARDAGGNWSSQRSLTASTPQANASFGFSVAVKGQTVLVGEPRFDNFFTDVGQAYLFRSPSAGTWDLEKTFYSPGLPLIPDGGAEFGFSVALDSQTAVIGACGLGTWTGGLSSSFYSAGKAYVSNYDGTAWSDPAELLAPGLASGSYMGMSVAVEGGTIAAGAFGNETQPGKVLLFQRSGNAWTKQGEVSASNGETDNAFGVSVALSGDTLIVGGYGIDTAGGVDAGGAYLFRVTDPDAKPPTLTVARNGANALLSWPSTAGWSLYQSSTLAPDSWQPVSVPSDGTYAFPISSAPRMFFRLEKH